MRRLMLDDYPWEAVERAKGFIRSLYAVLPPERPGVMTHPKPSGSPVGAPPEGLDDTEGAAWSAVEAFRRRPAGMDDFVPAVGTDDGACSIATAFGCPEKVVDGLRWVEPAITNPGDIKRARMPKTTDGSLGSILERTRRYVDLLDERIGIRTIDFQGPFTTVEQILGEELFFMMPYEHPDELRTLMDVVTDFSIEFLSEQMRTAGDRCCPGVWPSFWFPKEAGTLMSDDDLSSVTPGIYDEFVTPYNNRVSDAFGGLFLHSCVIKEEHIPVIKKIRRLTGVNCDVSNGVPPARLLEEFGSTAVVAPHVYMNSSTNLKSYAELMAWLLEPWRPGHRYFMHPCKVMRLPDESRDLPFDMEAVLSAMSCFQ